MKKIVRLIAVINEWAGRAVAFLIYPGMLVLVYEAAARYLSDAPTIWAHGMSQRIFAIYFVFGAPYVLLHDGHIRMDMIYNRFSVRTRAVIDLVTSPLLFVTIFALLWFGWDFAWTSIEAWERDSTPFHAPVWPVKVWIPITGGLLLLQALVRLGRDLATAVKGVRNEP